jgi:uncharacterized protein YbcI
LDSIDPPARRDTGAIASEISREIVRLHARLYGRGPTKAKTYFEEDYVLAILEDVFTPAERTLIGAGRGDHVYSTRGAFQEAVASDFVTIVETATGRKVRVFMSQVSVPGDIASELFLLEPIGAAEEDLPDAGDEDA